ncbi:MAG TPA: hypothetical protein VHB79_05970 [Polyangiaceae bacterium]|nr:hypothetical protein [Polyangiaceae bacterium]
MAQTATAQSTEKAERTAARALGTAGVEAYQEGDYAAASDKLEKAFQILKVPSLGLWSARALEKRGQLVEALNRYLEAQSIQVPAGEVAVQQSARKDAEREGEALKVRVPRLVIELTGAEPSEITLTIDGQTVASSVVGQPRLVNTGPHRVEAMLGARHANGEASCVEGQQCSVSLDLTPPAKPVAQTVSSKALSASPADSRTDGGRSWQPTLGWVAVGAGVAGVAVGGFFGFKAMSERKSLDDSGLCVGDRCPPSLQDSADRLGTYRTVSTVGFVAGGVLAAAGITLLVTAPSRHRETALFYVGPGSAGIRGSF